MDFRITIDISERLEKSLQALTTAIFNARVFPTPEECRAKYFADVDPEAEYVSQEKAENSAVETPKEPEAPITRPAPETPQTAPTDAQETTVRGCIVENPEPEPVAVLPAEAVASEQPEKKPVKKRMSKKAENLAVETPKEPEPAITPTEPKNAAEAKSEQPVDAKPEPSELKASDDDDPMCGMTVMDAMQAVMGEISEKGLEMADVNARVRARAAEAGIAYSSIICLIKAIGYREARRVALGEK